MHACMHACMRVFTFTRCSMLSRLAACTESVPVEFGGGAVFACAAPLFGYVWDVFDMLNLLV